jgi:hypothetical protein
MWALIIVTTFSVYGGQSPSTIQQEFATQELCIQAAKEIVPKLNDEGYVKVAKCVFTGVRK